MRRKKNKYIAALLAFILGSFGVHRFYLGDGKTGFLYLMIMFFTMSIRIPITAILGIIDGFKLLTMGQSEFDRKFNKHVLVNQRRKGRQYRPKGAPVQRPQTNTSNKKFKSRVNPFKKTAYKKYEEFDTEDAVKDLLKAIEIEPNNKDLYFKLAGAYSQLENATASLDALNLAIRNGYKDFEKINSIEDLAYLRIHPAFVEFKANNYSLEKVAKLAAPKENLLDNDVILSQLKKLVELREKGLLSESEYKKEKIKLMKK